MAKIIYNKKILLNKINSYNKLNNLKIIIIFIINKFQFHPMFMQELKMNN